MSCLPTPAPSIEYRRRTPERSDLHRAVRTWFASVPELLSEYLGARVRLPPFTFKAVEKFIDCGQLSKGFVRVRCGGCGDDRLVAFSCKVRGLCPSCDGRRMADEGAQLVDHVLAEVPYRQWVLTFPFWLRYRLAWDQPLRAAVLKVFTHEVEKFYLRCAGLSGAKAGGISVLHRFDSALKIDVHWHLLFADGVWSRQGQAQPKFHPLGKLEPEDVPHVLASIASRVHKLLKRRGLLHEELDDDQTPTDAFAKSEPALAAILKSSLFDLALFGPAHKPERERGPKPGVMHVRSRNCADLQQFSLHANSSIAACNRLGLEKMIRYLCRPAVASERVELLNGDREVRVRLKTAWKDGTTHIRLSGPDFVLRLVALIPAPRRALLHYHGVFAPSSTWRRQIVKDTPRPRVKQTAQTESAAKPTCGQHDPSEPCGAMTSRPSRMPWSDLMKRVFAYDVLHCAKCGGRRKLIATIPEGAIAVKILAHLQLPVNAEGFLPIRVSAAPKNRRIPVKRAVVATQRQAKRAA